MTRGPFRLVLQNAAAHPGTPARSFVLRCARAAFADAPGELVVRIVDEAESAMLNQRFRGKPGPTNVLSFEADELPPGELEPEPLGDIVICAPVVAREAEAQGKPPGDHWAHMIVHGCLHLAGYDHEQEADAVAMEARERELLAGLGIPDPYAREA